MRVFGVRYAFVCCAMLLQGIPGLLVGANAIAADASPATTESIELHVPCSNSQPLKQALFGDLHVHTGFSQDASTQGTRSTPVDAYRFARGEALGIQPFDVDGKPLRTLQLERPLDFAAVTDHAEQIGEVRICSTPGMEGYQSWTCMMYRTLPRVAFFIMNMKASIADGERFGFCGVDGKHCLDAAKGPWQETVAAAERFYDRSSRCEFTTFVGYEWTGTESQANLHRNVIFRNQHVPSLPVSFYEASTPEQLWAQLDGQCTGDCAYMIIPHNSNLSDGRMFKDVMDNGQPFSADYAKKRASREPLVEIMQHKGSSECYFGAGDQVGSADELCDFEQLPYSRFDGKFIDANREPVDGNAGFVRETLVMGLEWQRRLGANPYEFGIVGGTDTHLGAAGAVDERGFPGHGGAGVPADKDVPPGLADDVEFNPGGVTGVWAEENTRESIYTALRRRETFGTSGPRIHVRLFGGSQFPPAMCDAGRFVEQGYVSGVPMGSNLTLQLDSSVPTFAVAATYDPGTPKNPGSLLQRVQIIKGWVDVAGKRHTRVFDVAGDSGAAALPDAQNCAPSPKGHQALCAVWRDPQFKSSESAFYYARVLENASCRWSQHVCLANKVDCSKPDAVAEELRACCGADHRKYIQERAWTSPIWYSAPAAVSRADVSTGAAPP